MLKQLTEEEKKSKIMLDEKIDAEHQTETTNEDAKEMQARRIANKEEIIKQQLRLSQLKTQKKRLQEEDAELVKSNEATKKDNVKLTSENEKLEQIILELIQRIDVSTLLKEIDMEEMRHLAQQNTNMNMRFEQLIDKWEDIKKKSDEI